MNEDIRTKLLKIYALANQGATEGERAAAKKALSRLVEKHKLNEDDLQKSWIEKSMCLSMQPRLTNGCWSPS